jgi:oligoribonuclease (3'-5' exoribonuclease)
MHTKNGLIHEAVHDEGAIFLDDAISRITSILRVWARPKEVALAGRCVHFDRSFLKVYAPELEAYLHHRHLDVASIEMFLEHAGVNVERKSGPSRHRALDDILYSYDQYRNFLALTKPRLNGE